MSDEFRRDLVEQLIVVLEDVVASKKKFDLSYFISKNKDKNECGTTACAIGWAAYDPFFIENGLSIESYFENNNIITYTVVFDGELGFEAIRKMFNFRRYDTSNILFHDGRYRYHKSPKFVISRLKYLLNHGEEKLNIKYSDEYYIHSLY